MGGEEEVSIYNIFFLFAIIILTDLKQKIGVLSSLTLYYKFQDHCERSLENLNHFQERMNSLTLRVKQAHEDAEQVNISARKITSHFQKIENVQLDSADLTISHTTELLETLEENE